MVWMSAGERLAIGLNTLITVKGNIKHQQHQHVATTRN